MKLWLQQLGTAKGEAEICLDRFPFTVGRKSDCDCCLPYAFISRRHCRFVCSDEQVTVQDLESYNGTFVNGRKASRPLPVADGDEITLGPLSFRVVLLPVLHETAEVCHCPTESDVATLKRPA